MQGFNMGRYVPPDQEGLVTSGNALNKKHALGSRASKLASHGILTVRFEMPFAVWCDSCPKPTVIGQGVRFNAQKRRAGSYYTSPIYSFTLRHAACGGAIEIRTDPANTAYVVVSGGRKRDLGGSDEDSLVQAGAEFVIATEQERAERRETAFSKLEKTIEDRERLFEARERIGELQDAAERQWDDPYLQNQRLRKAFRVGRKARERDAVGTEALKERMGLGIELLPATEEDARRAALVDFGGVDVESDSHVERALAQPLFAIMSSTTNNITGKGAIITTESLIGGRKQQQKQKGKSETPFTQGKKLKSEIAADKTRENLVSEIVSNTRAARDPFLAFGSGGNRDKDTSKGSHVLLPGLKKRRRISPENEAEEVKRREVPDPSPPPPPPPPPEKSFPVNKAPTALLVSYDSDSD
jgi:coiled-coil domain-containing protein 130